MSNLCDNCKKNKYALVITKNINGEKSNTHLCYQCSLEMQTPLFLKSLFATILQVEKDISSYDPGPTCSGCQSTVDDLLKRGKVGCAMCYQTFSPELAAIMDSIQWSLKHKGKIPKHNGKNLRAKKEIEDLRRQLEKAISREEFEEAARLRDEIKALTDPAPAPVPIPETQPTATEADANQFTLDTLYDQNQIDISEHLASTQTLTDKPKKAKPKPKTDPKPKAEPKAKTEPKSKAEPKVKTEPKPKADPKPKTAPKPKANPKPTDETTPTSD